ncbi:hypothetical protein WMY93_004717 [Mugilogobius chulae]|uniref:Vacuolar protein sorting-associated protein 13A n=1 Tax=Mugilogobius chulae TaxID=88201 RepID=A0AAW0Q022_9GOBI
MVFESVVVDVLNRFLGDYVVNLDSSQLKLGIWGGDAILKNLEIKENALSQLDLPFKVKAGHIGRLELKIPWKNLYTQSVEASLDGVYLLIVPTASIKYDAEKEEKQFLEARQRELQRIEQTKLKAAEQENPGLEKQDTFVEKLVTQVIKNLQVKISNIHIRYEDDVTNPNCPLSFGVSLENLSLQTADQNWRPTVLDEKAKLFFKLVKLDNLFAYWNVNSLLFSNHDSNEALQCLKKSIKSNTTSPVTHDFVFRPISADAKLKMNPRSDVDFSSPKVDLMVNLREVAIELNRPQYISVLELLGSVDMMSRNLPYRKYRPDEQVHRNAKRWWTYVITSVLEVDVKPRLHMWSWKRISKHRSMVKGYKLLYKTKITSKKPSEELLRKLQEPEKTLDIFNITLARQQAEVEASKAGLKIYRPGLKMEEEESQGWFGWMWNWGGQAETEVKETKAGVTAQLTVFEVTGLAKQYQAPTLLSSRKAATVTGSPLLSILFETNPIDESANQRLYVNSQPLEIIYDATTVNGIAAFFRPPDDLELDELTNATLMKLEQFRDRTATGLMYVIETQKTLDLKVNLMASYVIIPQTGYYDNSQNILLLDLGQFKMLSKSRKNLPQLSVTCSNIEDIMSRAYDSFDIQLSSLQFLYSKPDGDWKKARKQQASPLHILEPVDLKVIFSRAMVVKDSRMAKYKLSGELPRLSLRISDSKLRSVLELVDSIPLPESPSPPARSNTHQGSIKPKTFTPQLTRRRPLSLGDQRASLFFESCETITSLTSLGSEEDLFYDAPTSPLEDKPFFPDQPKPLRTINKPKIQDDAQKNMTDLILNFEIDMGLGTELKLCTFDMTSNTYLKEICLMCPEYMDSEAKEVQLITTRDNDEEDLLTLEYIKADRKGPEFKSLHNNTEQLIKGTFSSLDVHLHTEALLNTLNFLENLVPSKASSPKQPGPEEAGSEELAPIPEEDEEKDQEEKDDEKKEAIVPIRKPSVKNSKFADIVNLHIRADLRCLKVFIRGEKARISEISIEGLVSEVLMRKKEMEIQAYLKNIVILNCDKDALYKTAVSIADKEVFSFHMVNYTCATEGDAYLDMTKVDTYIALSVGCIQVVFLNKFLSSILAFVNNFQEAKAALAEVTVQAAEKAAFGVKELAERSTRIFLSVRFNAPVIFLPQSSSSSNVIVADLGRLSIKNRFVKQPWKSDAKIPPIVDIMKVTLTDLKMYRTTFKNDKYQGEVQLLMPVSLDLEVRRNLSSNWYHDIPDIEIIAHLKPMSLILSQDDLIVVLKTLNENLSETSELSDPSRLPPITDPPLRPPPGNQGPPNPTKTQVLDSHDEQLKLAEFTLGTISTSFTCSLTDDSAASGAEQNMIEVKYRQGREGTVLDTLVQDIYLCASMEFLLTVANIFLTASQQGFGQAPQNKSNAGTEKKNASSSVASKETWTRDRVCGRSEPGEAPALVMTTQCELIMKSSADGSRMTAGINDLKVVACPFLKEKRKNNVTTVLQPCQVFFQSSQTPQTPQAMEISINTLTLKVSPIIINTVITIQSALTPTAETPEELDSPVPVDLWERRSWRDLKLWFLDEERDEDQQVQAPLIPQGESLQMSIKSICVTLEAGVGHRTVPMLLAKSSFHGDVTNWSTLINLHSALNLEVHYHNEMLGVWEPLVEPLEDEKKDGFKPWTLELKMKKKVVKKEKKNCHSDEVDYIIPDYKTVIVISSSDQLNITVSKCGLAMLSNLGTAFAEAAKQTAECFQKDEAPFVVKNRLGLPVSVRHSEMFSPILQDGDTLGMDYSTTESDQFSAMTSLSGKDYYIQPTPVGHTSTSVIPLIKVGRGMYSVVHRDSGVTRFLVCQISSVEGSKYIKIRSPFQIINHFSISFKVFEGQTFLGTALPTEEFCVPLDSYRSELSLQPVMNTDEEEAEFYCSEGFSYEDLIKQTPEQRIQQICKHRSNQDEELGITLMCPLSSTCGPLYWLRNLLPYPITYKLKGTGEKVATLEPGHSAQLLTAVIDESSLDLCLINYLAQDWASEYSLCSDQDEITFVVFKSLREDEDVNDGAELKRAELDIAVHMSYDQGQTVVAIHSPYWMINKTGRLLQYKADDIHRKHPMDYNMPLLFSFKPRYFLRNNKVRLMISDSELSDEFSLDTVGSHGEVKCKGRYKDYMVGVKIEASSFSLTRIVTFVPFYTLVNRTKHKVFVCEEGLENWTESEPEQSAVPFWPENDTKKLMIKVEGLSPPQVIDFTRPENCLLLHLDNSVGGIIVDVNVSEHSLTILSLSTTKFSGGGGAGELEPGKAVYYTWTQPTGSRELCWKCGPYSGKLESVKDQKEDMNKDGKLFVVSFYEGLQRVVLFTEEKSIFYLLLESEKAQLAEQEIILDLLHRNHQFGCGLGVQAKKEEGTLENSVHQRAEILERSYQSYLSKESMEGDPITLRTTFRSASVLVCVTTTELLPRPDPPHPDPEPAAGGHLPLCFYPVKLPKSIVMEAEPKPLTDISIVTRTAGHSDISRIKYFVVLIQEMDLKLDLGFLYAILDLFTPENASSITTEQEVELFGKDLEYIQTELNHGSAADNSPISLFEFFHISPIKMHLSFSLSTGGEDGLKEKRDKELIPVQSLNLLLKSIGATLTDVQDVVFKLAFFELKFKFCTTQQLQWEVIRHYSKQAIKQMYVLVLGLDVLGNPFGLIRGLSEGVEAFFYEPWQGAIQGPEEFVEGMALGVKALVGGAVGGLAELPPGSRGHGQRSGCHHHG